MIAITGSVWYLFTSMDRQSHDTSMWAAGNLSVVSTSSLVLTTWLWGHVATRIRVLINNNQPIKQAIFTRVRMLKDKTEQNRKIYL